MPEDSQTQPAADLAHPAADPDDFAALYSKCHLPLLRYIMTLVPHREQAEDILQNTARRLWQKFDRYDPSQPFWPWARKFAYFEALRHRKEYVVRTGRVFSDEMIETLAEERVELEDVLDERRAALDGCLAKIDEPSRQLLMERYSDEQSITEVAARVGKSRNALYLVLHRLRKSLVDCVNRRLRVEGWAN